MQRTCGSCRYFKATAQRDDGRVGVCRLEKLMGVFRESMRACPSFSIHGDPDPPVVVDGARRSRGSRRGATEAHVVTVSSGTLHATLQRLGGEQLKGALREVLAGAMMLRETDLGRRWSAGRLELEAASDGARPKSLGLDVFFHKLVMMRDNLRVLEQKINSHAQLHDAEKVDLQRRITLCHEALTEMGTGWLPWDHPDDATGEALARLRELVGEIRWSALALPPPPLAERWCGGRVRYVTDGEEIDEPLERFYERLLVLRDRLHALEAQISAHPHIAPDEAESMAGYIRRCYGTLTTFNVLFRDREAYFTSTK